MAHQHEHEVTQIPVLLQLLKMIGYPQIDILRRELSSGFPLLGKLTLGINWYIRTDDKYISPSSIDELRQHNHEYVLKKLREIRVDDHHEFMLDENEIISEVNIGRMNGPFEAPATWETKCTRPRHCPHLTLLPIPHEFPMIAVAASIEQIGSDVKKKMRRGEDWRRSGHNRTCTMHDQPFHHTPDHFASLGILASNKHPQSQLDVWGRDHDGAYRQLPLDDPEVAYVLLITPEGPTLWNHNVLLFGSATSVWSYNRFGDIMTSISRVLNFSPVLHYVDDHGSMEPDDTAQSSFESFEEFNGVLGFTMKPSKRQPPLRRQRMQGVIIESDYDTIVLSPCPQRAGKVGRAPLKTIYARTHCSHSSIDKPSRAAPWSLLAFVGFCRHSLDPVCQAFWIMPSPMCSNQAIQGLMLTNALDEGMSRCRVITTLDVKVLKTRSKNNRCHHRHPGFEKVNERLGVAELKQDLFWQTPLKVCRFVSVTVDEDEASCAPTIL